MLLGTVLLDAEATGQDHPLDDDPCLEYNLCVAASPVGAISNQGDFNLSACLTPNAPASPRLTPFLRNGEETGRIR